MSHESPSFIEIINSAMEYTIPIAHTMGVRAVEVRRGYAALSVPIEGNGNHFGVMYAGVLFTVAEMLGGVLALPVFDNARFYPLVKDVQISFLKPARTDVVSEASLSDEEIARVASLMVDRFGVRSIRLTGGEPTVRAKLPPLPFQFALQLYSAGLSNGRQHPSTTRTPLVGHCTNRLNGVCRSRWLRGSSEIEAAQRLGICFQGCEPASH